MNPRIHIKSFYKKAVGDKYTVYGEKLVDFINKKRCSRDTALACAAKLVGKQV